MIQKLTIAGYVTIYALFWVVRWVYRFAMEYVSDITAMIFGAGVGISWISHRLGQPGLLEYANENGYDLMLMCAASVSAWLCVKVILDQIMK